MSPPLGLAHVAAIALYAIRSARSAAEASPNAWNIVAYENIASTTPQSSMPRDGEWPAAVSISSSPTYMPVGSPQCASSLSTRVRERVRSEALRLCRHLTAADFNPCAALTLWTYGGLYEYSPPVEKLPSSNHFSQLPPCEWSTSPTRSSSASWPPAAWSSSHCTPSAMSCHRCAAHDVSGVAFSRTPRLSAYPRIAPVTFFHFAGSAAFASAYMASASMMFERPQKAPLSPPCGGPSQPSAAWCAKM